jgi:PKD repeat protein
MKYLKFLTLFLSALSLNLTAQHQHNGTCGHDAVMEQYIAENPNYLLELQELDNMLSADQPEASQGVVRIIPVVFHIVYATQADNITAAQIRDGLRILNEDFRRQNADTNLTRSIFKGVAADMEIEFRLAQKDPQGNCTDGITRTQSNESLTGDNDVKDVINWDNSRYYNIWITRNVLGSERGQGRFTLGYSSFPQNGTQSYRNDGTVMRHDELGLIGTAVGQGRTLTHETGHYLALFHPFQPPRGSSNGCIGTGDQVADTPPVASENQSCDLSTNSCTSDNLPDQIENYMDYATCQNMFTAGQKVRMVGVVTTTSLRGGMVSSGNLNFTGVNNPPACAPEARFSAERKFVCTNEPIQFFDESEEGTPTAWSWIINTATPTTSNQQNPTFTFAMPGRYDVTLQATNGAGSNTLTRTAYLDVKNASSNTFDKLWTESFEAASMPNRVSAIDLGGDGVTFEIAPNAGSHINQSTVLRNNALYTGEVDELITPAILTKGGGSDLNLFFDIAFAARLNTDNDLLEVFVSRDCGVNWNRRRFYNSSRLRTANNTFNNFIPTAQEWTTETINFGAYIQDDPIIIKFVFTNGGGNNLYIDNIRFGEGPDVGMNELNANAGMQLYPNPNTGSFTLKAGGQGNEELALTIFDVSGKRVYEQTLPLKNGITQKQLQLNLKPGIYLLNVAGADAQYSERLIIK